MLGARLTVAAAKRYLSVFLLLVATLGAGLLAASDALAVEPVKISREDTALNLTATTEVYANQGEAFQVSTAAGAVAMLAGDDAAFITGQTLHVDGGLVMR